MYVPLEYLCLYNYKGVPVLLDIPVVIVYNYTVIGLFNFS